MSNIKNINLQVAKFALECVNKVKDDNRREYKTLVRKMPTLIQKNGFINTLVFNLSKQKNKNHQEVLYNIINWSNKNEKIKYLLGEQSQIDQYIEKVVKLKQSQYRLVTKEMINLFVWIKRFADGMIEDE